LSGIKIWNYNKNEQDVGRGVKLMKIVADGTELTPDNGILVRKAPGNTAFEFS